MAVHDDPIAASRHLLTHGMGLRVRGQLGSGQSTGDKLSQDTVTGAVRIELQQR